MTPRSAGAMRAALDARLNNQARALGIDAGRLRRRLVFQRILRRLSSDGTWVLKGGYLLETRLGDGFRSTRDLDLAVTTESSDLIERLEDELVHDPDRDHFWFAVTGAAPLADDSAGRGGWRFSITASLDGRPFSLVRIDVVERPDEVAGGTETFDLAPPVDGVGFAAAPVVAVDVAQHAAEKLHALCRLYSGNRPSTRVKDLVDVCLMIESGLLPHPALGERLRSVFRVRDNTDPPAALPDPPASWSSDYATLAAETSSTVGFDDAFRIVGEEYRRTLG